MEDQSVQKKMTKEEREAEVNAPETLRWMATQVHKYTAIMSDIVRGIPVDEFEQDLLTAYRLRLYHQKLIDSQD